MNNHTDNWRKELEEKKKEFTSYFEGLGQGSLKGLRVASPGSGDSTDCPISERWWNKFIGKLTHKTLFYHDEPWLSLVAMWGLFGDQSPECLASGASMINEILKQGAGAPNNPPQFKEVENCSLELQLPECLRYRQFVKESLQKTACKHPYYERHLALQDKIAANKSSVEGNTQVDIIISGKAANNKPLFVFIEAKFLSDISCHTTYVPVRNQIIRNIDSALEYVLEKGYGIDSFCFLLLSPEFFRNSEYGGSAKSQWAPLPGGDTSRLYSYKMNEYRKPALLKAALPHWQHYDTPRLGDDDYERLANRIGWITFEDIVQTSPTDRAEVPLFYENFFRERGLWPC